MSRPGANSETGNYRFDLDRYVEPAATALAITTLGAAAGAATGIVSSFHRPVHVEFARNIEGDVLLSTSTKGVDATTTFGGIYLPNAPIDSVVNGIKINFTKLGLDLNKPGESSLGSILSQPESAVGQPIKDAIEARVITDAVVGAIAVPVAYYAILGLYRRRQNNKDDITTLQGKLANIDDKEVKEAVDNLGDSFKPKKYKRKAQQALAIGASFLAFAGVYHTVKELNDDYSPPRGVNLKASIAKRSALTAGAKITGPNAKIFETGLNQAFDAIENGNNFWQKAAKDFDNKLEVFKQNKGFEFFESKNPDEVTILDINTTACNQSYINHFLSNLVSGFKPQIAIVGGDIFSNGKSSSLENRCDKDLFEQLGDIPVISVRGNHDPKSWSINSLDKKSNFSRKVGGITFVGAPDPTYSTWGPTKPEKLIDRYSLIAKQGSEIADKACEITDKTGIKPFVISHNSAASTEVFMRECVSVADTGHGFDNPKYPKLSVYQNNDGSFSFKQFATTASGANGGLTNTRPAKRPASAIIQRVNKITGELVDTVEVIIEENASTRINLVTPPVPKQIPNKDKNFVYVYSPTPASKLAR